MIVKNREGSDRWEQMRWTEERHKSVGGLLWRQAKGKVRLEKWQTQSGRRRHYPSAALASARAQRHSGTEAQWLLPFVVSTQQYIDITLEYVFLIIF